MRDMDIASLRELAEKLRIKSGMMKMGERIAWGSDTELMDEAEAGILALIDENDRLRATIIAMRDRDDRNDSLPPWYREQIDAALAQHEDDDTNIDPTGRGPEPVS